MEKIFVHKYRYSHEKLRKKCRKLLKQGELKLVERTKDGFIYTRVTKPAN